MAVTESTPKTATKSESPAKTESTPKAAAPPKPSRRRPRPRRSRRSSRRPSRRRRTRPRPRQPRRHPPRSARRRRRRRRNRAKVTGPFWVQVGAFKDPDTAKRVATALRDQNYKVGAVRQAGEREGGGGRRGLELRGVVARGVSRRSVRRARLRHVGGRARPSGSRPRGWPPRRRAAAWSSSRACRCATPSRSPRIWPSMVSRCRCVVPAVDAVAAAPATPTAGATRERGRDAAPRARRRVHRRGGGPGRRQGAGGEGLQAVHRAGRRVIGTPLGGGDASP